MAEETLKEPETMTSAEVVASVPPAITPGSARIEAELRARLAPLHDTFHALRRLQVEDKPAYRACMSVIKRIEYWTKLHVDQILDEPQEDQPADDHDGPDSTGASAHAPAPATISDSVYE
jgi:hypothetical protein